MLVKDFSFDLPEELIAQVPAKVRGEDRLLVIDKNTGEYLDSEMKDFPSFLDDDCLLVVNNSKVRKARVYGITENNGKVEFLFLSEREDHCWLVMTNKAKKQKIGKGYTFLKHNGEIAFHATIVESCPDGLKYLKPDIVIDETFFIEEGHVPLPPYIKREDDFQDETRYQTIYADKAGSVASPTAGLHFTPEIMKKIKEKGVKIAFVTLHVGMGTFIPMRGVNIEDHHMHYESYYVSEEAAAIINDYRKKGKKIVATGTTSVRTLESAYNVKTDMVETGYNKTNLFISPGYKFNVVNQLLTNFHTPESTLLVLVSSFAGREHIMKAYKHAIEKKYRFFSYGDATFLK